MSVRKDTGVFDTPRLKWINFYPPFLGAGIRVLRRKSDQYTVMVQMKETFYNHNALGTHFGGSLYAMCDPFFVLILIHNLGNGYVVWDKSAVIDFVTPGRGTVSATFHIPPDEIDEIRRKADAGMTLTPVFSADIIDEKGKTVARVEKKLYVRRRGMPF